jgi:hypothetical protein
MQEQQEPEELDRHGIYFTIAINTQEKLYFLKLPQLLTRTYGKHYFWT